MVFKGNSPILSLDDDEEPDEDEDEETPPVWRVTSKIQIANNMIFPLFISSCCRFVAQKYVFNTGSEKAENFPCQKMESSFATK